MIIQIERAVLSTLFFYQNTKEIANILRPYDFYLPVHQEIFGAMVKLSNEGISIDETFVLKNTKNVQEEDLIQILSVNAIVNFMSYVEDIKEASRKRTIERINVQVKKELENNEKSAFEIIHDLKKTITNFEKEQVRVGPLKIKSFSSIEESEPEFYLEDDLPIQKEEVNIISAKGGNGKSYVAALLLLLLANKHNLKCFGWFSEDKVGVTKKRFNLLAKLHKLNTDNITIIGKENRAMQFVYLDGRKLIISQKFHEVKMQLAEYDIILWDPIIGFYGADENSNSEARFFMNLINEWCEEQGKTFILIHHHSKGDGGTARGAGAFIDACRIHYTIDYKYKKTTKGFVPEPNFRTAKIEKTNHFSGKMNYDLKLFDNSKLTSSMIKNKSTYIDDPDNDKIDDF